MKKLHQVGFDRRMPMPPEKQFLINYCESKGVPAGETWLAEVKRYEKEVLSKRQ